MVVLTKNQWLELPEKHFANATDGQVAKQETIVKLKYDDGFLFVNFECRNNPYWADNSYIDHNSDMWNQEVFELFISNEVEKTEHYLEFEINPNNAIWVGRINNPAGNAPVFSETQMIDYEATNIVHEVGVDMANNTWFGRFQIPWELIGRKQTEYRLNFYRIISTKKHRNTNWTGTPDDCLYLCWQPTMSGLRPAFHISTVFEKLILA